MSEALPVVCLARHGRHSMDALGPAHRPDRFASSECRTGGGPDRHITMGGGAPPAIARRVVDGHTRANHNGRRRDVKTATSDDVCTRAHRELRAARIPDRQASTINSRYQRVVHGRVALAIDNRAGADDRSLRWHWSWNRGQWVTRAR
jgi:hypothetical protein